MARLYDDYIHTDQVLWCIRENQLLGPPPPGQYVHEIEADQRDIVAVLDEFVWKHIIGDSGYIPAEDHERLRYSIGGLSGDRYLAELARSENKYIADRLPKDLWGSLIVDNLSTDLVTVLLRWPFPCSSIVSVRV